MLTVQPTRWSAARPLARHTTTTRPKPPSQLYDTPDAQLTGRCTSANVAVDFSNYWAPQLYRKADNGSLSLVKLTYANTYYL